MKYMFLDTNIYIDMIVSRNNTSKAGSFEEIYQLLEHDMLKIILPKIVKEEVKRHIESEILKIGKAVKDARKNIKEIFWINHVDLLKKFNDQLSSVNQIMGKLDDEFDVHKRIFIINSIGKINSIFNHRNCIEIIETREMLLGVDRRRIYKQAPAHIDNKDSSADALIVETLVNIKDFIDIDNDNDKIFFISRNTADFSQGTKKDEKEILHPDIYESLKSRSLEEVVKYRIRLTKTILDEFKHEAEKISIINELWAEMKIEEEEERKTLIMDKINMDRESVGLTPLGSCDAYYERIFEMKESLDFIQLIESKVSEYEKVVQNFLEIYDDTIDELSNISFNDLKDKLDLYNDKYKFFPIIYNKVNAIDSISDYIKLYFGNPQLLEDSLDSIIFNDYMDIDNILLMKNQYGQPIKIEVDGELEPEDDETNTLEIWFSVDGQRVSSGEIEVYYGYMTFNSDGNASDGSEESIDFKTDDIACEIESTFDSMIDVVETTIKRFELFLDSLGI
ncbi:MAG: PIN domain-containing protein [Tissierellales bacterium]|jgi:hypothetical protein|nr:PIN domain-containing protein [Tissierellales bacterium]